MGPSANLSLRVGPLRTAPPERRAALLASFPAVATWARSRTTSAETVLLGDGLRAVRKTWRWPGVRDRVKGLFRTTFAAPSPAEREFAALARLRALASGPFSPEPLVWADERRAGVLAACVLLLEEIRDATDLAVFLRDETDPARRSRVLADLAGRTREMHAAGLADREHHARNVLVAGDRTWKVDCWKQRARGRPLSLRETVGDLAALDVALVRLASARERDAFYAAVCGGPPPREFLAHIGTARTRIEPRESRRLPV